ncbi:hypothetical protein [Kordia sp.]|uniref:hypothetical protein n=1 Tax=Kordia sp. TaxID=1965332 RepID=UPI003D6A837B
MLKSILKIKNIEKLTKEEQRSTLGGMQFLCEETCILGLRLCYINRTDTFYQPC